MHIDIHVLCIAFAQTRTTGCIQKWYTDFVLFMLQGGKISPLVRYSILNVIYAYAYTVRMYNGEHHDLPVEASQVAIYEEYYENLHIDVLVEVELSILYSDCDGHIRLPL